VKSLDSSLSVQTPEGVEFALYPAGFLVRACAWAIDSLITWCALIVAMVLYLYFSGLAGRWVFLLGAFVINWFYHVIFELAFHGQSAGKRLMGIRVVRSDGSPVSPGASFIRNLLRFADVFMFLNLAALLCISLSQGFRRIGDWAGDTLVVYSFGREALRGSLSWLSGVEFVCSPRPLSWEEKQAILMFARRYPLLGPARADEIARDYVRALRGEASFEGSESAWLLGIARGLSGGLP
jgi:uncharacterized RDD family membrane protein YckC